MKKQIYSLFVVTIAFSMSACSFKKSDRGANEEAQPTELTTKNDNPAAPRGAGGSLVAAQVENLDLKSIYAQTNAIKSEADAVSIIESLEKSAIQSNVWGDPKLRISDNVITALSYYNWAVVRLIEIAPDSKQTASVIERYKKMAMEGCSDQLTNCQNILWLRKDTRSTKVVQMMAELLDKKMDSECKADCTQSLKQYYDLLAVAFDVKSAFLNPKLEFLYLKRASQLSAAFKVNSEQDSAFIKRHGKIFETLISLYPADSKNKDFAAFVKAFQPWTYSHLNANPFPFGAEKMFSFAALHYLYTDGKSTLNPDLRAAIQQSQDQDDKLGASFKKSLQTLTTDPRSMEIFKGLELDLSSIQGDDFYNEYFFMIDRLYRGHLNLDEVGSIWQGSQQDEKKLMKVLNAYIKIELIKRIVATNQYLGGIFLQKNIKNDDLFKQAIQKSEPLTKEWDVMTSQMDRISIFFGQQLRSSTTNSSGNSNLKEAQLMIDSVKRNAKFLSVYPNMMLLGYFMIGADAPLKFTTWWGSEVAVDPTTVVDFLLNGGFKDPWFIFGGDTSPLNRSELIYAFHYALSAGSFETFSAVKDSRGLPVIDRLSFFQKALKKTMLKDVSTLNDAITSLRDSRTSNAMYPQLMDICANEAKKNKNYSIPMKLEDLPYFALFGNSTKGPLGAALKFYSPMKEFIGIRDGYESRLVQLKAMMEPLQSNLERINLPKGEAVKIKKQLQAELDELENLKKDFLKEAVRQHRELTACSNHLIWLERERESQIFTAEMAYLGQVYDAMAALKGLSGEPRKQKAAELMKSLQMSEGENIEADAYIFSRWDLINRFARYSAALKPTLQFEQPDSSVKDTLRSEIRQITFISKSSGEVLSREAFISSGMTLLNSQSASTIAWLQDIANLDAWQNKIDTLVALYKMGFDTDLYKDPKSSIAATEVIDLTLEAASFVHIQDSEKPWLNKMNQNELIPREKLKGFLFDSTETEFRGVLDGVYASVTNVSRDLDEAVRHALASTNKGSFLFPVPQKLESSIDSKYRSYVTRSENIIKSFDEAIEAKQKNFDLKSLQVTYRLDSHGNSVYSPNLIDGGTSVLVDVRKQNNNKAVISDFHTRRTSQFYKESAK